MATPHTNDDSCWCRPLSVPIVHSCGCVRYAAWHVSTDANPAVQANYLAGFLEQWDLAKRSPCNLCPAPSTPET